MTSQPASISFRAITKRYGELTAVDGLSLEVPSGQFLVLLGPSGCGKTTLLRLTGGLIFPDDGEIHFGDRMVHQLPPKHRDAAMVFQSYALYPHLSVSENVGFPLKAQKRPADEIRARVHAVAQRLSLDDQLDKRPEQLSGGQAQRVALGRAIVREPSVFLMDEPLSNLDAKLRIQLRVELKRLHQQLAITTLYVTHDQEEALTLGDRIAVMSQGRIEQLGTPESIYHDPETLFVARFVGSPEINTVAAQIAASDNGRLVPRGQGVRIAVERTDRGGDGSRDVTVAIRPEAVRFGDPGRFGLAGTIDVVEMVGRESRLYVNTEAGTIVGIAPASDRRYDPGDRVSLGFVAEGQHIFDTASGHVLRSIRPKKEEALHA